MKYLILVLLLISCTKSPGTFEATVVGLYKNDDVELYNAEYGNFRVYDSPFIDKIKYQDQLIIACTVTKGYFAPYNCKIISRK